MCKSFAWYETTLATTWGGESDPDIGRWFHPMRRHGSIWRHPKRGVPGLEPIPDNWWLRQTSRCIIGVGQGRLWCTTARQDRYICQMAVRHRHSTARALQMDFLQASRERISDQIMGNTCRLHENSLYSRRSASGPILTREHHRARLDFAQDHQHWQLRHWRPTLFTDESRFHVSTCDQRVRVWGWAGEWYADSNIVEYDR